MSDWQIGDLAVCVRKENPETPINLGDVFRVAAVVRDYAGVLGLLFEDGPPPGDEWLAWYAGAFRKIRPDEHEDCEPEFVTLLKRSKQRQPA